MKILQEVPVEFDDGSYEFLGQDKVKRKLSGGSSKKKIHLIQAGELESFLTKQRHKSFSKGSSVFGKLKNFFREKDSSESNNIVLDKSSKVKLKQLLVDLIENQDYIEQNKIMYQNNEFFFSTKLSYELTSSLIVFTVFLDNGLLLVLASLSNGVVEPVLGIKKNRRYGKRIDLDFFFNRLPELYFSAYDPDFSEKEETFIGEIVDISFEGMGIVLSSKQKEKLDLNLKEGVKIKFSKKEFETRFESMSFEIPSGSGIIRWLTKDTSKKGQIRAGLEVKFNEPISSQHYQLQCWKAKQMRLQNNK